MYRLQFRTMHRVFWSGWCDRRTFKEAFEKIGTIRRHTPGVVRDTEFRVVYESKVGKRHVVYREFQ